MSHTYTNTKPYKQVHLKQINLIFTLEFKGRIFARIVPMPRNLKSVAKAEQLVTGKTWDHFDQERNRCIIGVWKGTTEEVRRTRVKRLPAPAELSALVDNILDHGSPYPLKP
jgi:hypothetical protein